MCSRPIWNSETNLSAVHAKKRLRPFETSAALGSFCVASAMFLILELSQPYSSAIRVSPDGRDRAGLELDKP
jgi:hypothetical protein